MGIEHVARLGDDDRAAITAHLTTLDKGGRALRFGSSLHYDGVAKYVATIDFSRDILEGVWDDNALVGVAHLAIYREDGRCVGELGISVLPEGRHQHLGQRLLSRTLLHARLNRVARVHVEFLVRNRPMARLAREFTDLIEMDHGEAHAIIDMADLLVPLAA
jgi:GNAT superfamily N-acetyltransferase